MSKERAAEFINAAQADAELRGKIQNHINDDAIMDVAGDHGYEFSKDDLHDAMKDKWGNSEDPNFCFICI